VEGSKYSLQEWTELGLQLPNYYGVGVTKPGYQALDKVRRESLSRFMDMDLFFVKVGGFAMISWRHRLTDDLQISDLMYIVPNFPHLRDVKVTVTYRELPASFEDWTSFKTSHKWKQDLEYRKFLNTGFGPRDKYYVNGVHIGDEPLVYTQVSNTPFPEPRYPRRNGLYRVFPGEADYEKLCRAQGLEHLLKTPSQSPSLPNGFSSPTNQPQAAAHSLSTAAVLPLPVNGTSPVHAPDTPGAPADPAKTKQPPNGITETPRD
jgi:hypothetical protein